MAIETADTVSTTLIYSVPPADGSKPYQNINASSTTGERDRNYTRTQYQVQIENIRGKENTVSLDTTGFQFVHAPAQHKKFDNDEEVEREYYPESIELIKKITGASRVVLFDHSGFNFFIFTVEVEHT